MELTEVLLSSVLSGKNLLPMIVNTNFFYWLFRLERTRANLIAERNNAIAALKELDPTYLPPIGFHFKNAKLEDRVVLPAEVKFLIY